MPKDSARKSELFNLARDPGENTNLADTRTTEVAQLRQELNSARAADRDAVAPVDN